MRWVFLENNDEGSSVLVGTQNYNTPLFGTYVSLYLNFWDLRNFPKILKLRTVISTSCKCREVKGPRIFSVWETVIFLSLLVKSQKRSIGMHSTVCVDHLPFLHVAFEGAAYLKCFKLTGRRAKKNHFFSRLESQFKTLSTAALLTSLWSPGVEKKPAEGLTLTGRRSTWYWYHG